MDSAAIADSVLIAIALTPGSVSRWPFITSEAVAMLVARAASPFIVALAAMKASPVLLDIRLDETEAKSLARVFMELANFVQ